MPHTQNSYQKNNVRKCLKMSVGITSFGLGEHFKFESIKAVRKKLSSKAQKQQGWRICWRNSYSLMDITLAMCNRLWFESTWGSKKKIFLTKLFHYLRFIKITVSLIRYICLLYLVTFLKGTMTSSKYDNNLKRSLSLLSTFVSVNATNTPSVPSILFISVLILFKIISNAGLFTSFMNLLLLNALIVSL